jgi:DNA-binding SARP family transcriptional activator
MKRWFFIGFIPFFFCFIKVLSAAEQSGIGGVAFSGDRRLSPNEYIDLTNNTSLSLPEHFRLEFDLCLDDPDGISYLFELKLNDGNLLHCTYFHGMHSDTATISLSFNKCATEAVITFPKGLPNTSLWKHVIIEYDAANETLALTYDTLKTQCTTKNLTRTIPSATLMFCFSEERKMRLRDISISGISGKTSTSLLHRWPLDECEGDIVHDVVGNADGIQSGIQWLLPTHYHWTYEETLYSYPVSNLNRINPYHFPLRSEEGIVIFDSTQSTFYNLRSKKRSVLFRYPATSMLVLYYHPLDGHFYQCQAGDAPMSKYDPKSEKWEKVAILPNDSLEYYNALLFYDPLHKSLLRFGGYGHFTTKNSLWCYNFSQKKWKQLTTKGEQISPRMVSRTSYSYSADSTKVYFMGGMGFISGRQVDGRTVFSDLWELDLAEYSFKKVYSIEQQDLGFVCYGIRLQGDQFLYSFFADEMEQHHVPSSHYFMVDPKNNSVTQVCDTIVIGNKKVPWVIAMFSAGKSDRLYSIVCDTTTDYLYSITTPLLTTQEYETYRNKYRHDQLPNSASLIIGGLFLAAASVFVFVYNYKKRRKGNLPDETIESVPQPVSVSIETVTEENNANTITLFGTFAMYDAGGIERSESFAEKPLELFLYLLVNGPVVNIGRLSEELWPDMPEENQRNTRNVAFTRLRQYVKTFSTISVSIRSRSAILHFPDTWVCDYYTVKQLIEKNILSRDEYKQISSIVRRGLFLASFQYGWADNMRYSVAEAITKTMIVHMKMAYIEKQWEDVVECGECLLSVDGLNGFAMQMKIEALIHIGRYEHARIVYERYVKEYLSITGKPYEKPFTGFFK